LPSPATRPDVPVVMYSTTLWRSKAEARSCTTRRPRYMTATRSATSKTSLRLCEIIITARPRSRRRRTRSSTIVVCTTPSAAVVRQREVLVDRLDAEPGGIARAVDLDRPAFPQELAVVDLVDPGDALRQDRLAGPVVPHQRGRLSGRQVEVDVIEGLDRTEVLLDAPQREEGPRSGGRVFGHLRHAFTLAREERGRRRAGGGAIVI